MDAVKFYVAVIGTLQIIINGDMWPGKVYFN